MEPLVKTSWNDPMPGIKATMRKGLLEVLAKVTAEAKSLAPKDTGLLANSTMWQMEGETGGLEGNAPRINEPSEELVGYVGSAVKYAIYQEAGTRHLAPHPFLRPAVAVHAQWKNVAEVMRKWEKIRAAGQLKQGENREGF